MKENIFFPENVKDKLKRLDVCLVYLFGSHAEGMAQPVSDIDIGIVMNHDRRINDTGELYNNLFDIFTDCFPGESIDIVFLQRAGLELCFDVISHGKVLFELEPDFRDNYEQKIHMLYMDFKPILREFDMQVLERI